MAEVLEHLEAPSQMINKICSLCNSNAHVYITVPINAPAIDHIYLFKTIEEVQNMIVNAGFEIQESMYAPAGDMELKTAIKKRNAIIVGILARRI